MNHSAEPDKPPQSVPQGKPLRRYEQQFRVCYHETDGQRRVHHSNYLNYFERGRVEMLRAAGLCYKRFEDEGLFLVVTEMNIRYFLPADFDDLLTLTTDLKKIRKVRIEHHYEIRRGDELIVEADSVIACVDCDGKPRRLPPPFQ